jgi:hypothetical protein
MRTRESMLALIQELEGDVTELDRLKARNETAWGRIEAGADDPVDWGALGFTIQSLYGVLENYFLRVSKYFENNLPSDRWHQALVDRMALEIPDVRPALLTDPGTTGMVREVLRFRHRLRNLYGEDLDPGKTRDIQQTVTELLTAFPRVHRSFVAKLRSIADAL